MYKQHFGLREKPFSLAASTEYLYLSEKHKDATLSKEGLSDSMSFRFSASITTRPHRMSW